MSINLDSTGALYSRTLPDGRVVHVLPMTFGKGRVCIGPPPPAVWYDDLWCYESHAAAIAAAQAWDPDRDEEPSGWFRHPPSGRSRENGDPARERVYW